MKCRAPRGMCGHRRVSFQPTTCPLRSTSRSQDTTSAPKHHIGAQFHRPISQRISRSDAMVVILSEKDMLPPPPPYLASSEPISPPPFPGRRDPARITGLPPHILLYIVHQTLPQTDGVYDGEGKVELQRKVLYWMTLSLRLVNRSFYVGECILNG